MEYVKKTVLGYKPLPPDAPETEATHVILTSSEYQQILRDRDSAITAARETREKADAQISWVKHTCQQQIYKAQEATQQQLDEMHSQVLEAQGEAEFQRGLNANLLRISKERANADRKLRPKREHTGYVVISSSEVKYIYKAKRTTRSVLLWETVLQSPYTVAFSEDQARHLIFDALDDQDSLLFQLGIEYIVSVSYEDLLKDPIEKWKASNDGEADIPDIDPTQENTLFLPQCRLRANFRAGYWEITLSHSLPLGPVPAEMCYRQI